MFSAYVLLDLTQPTIYIKGQIQCLDQRSGANQPLVNDLALDIQLNTSLMLHNGLYTKLHFVYYSCSRTRQNIYQVYLRKADVKLMFGLETSMFNSLDTDQERLIRLTFCRS